jgi:UDPglucose 6-dehydrogenase
LKGRTVGLLGLAFKPDTDDLREAPALDIGRKLIERGARVKAHDPVAMGRFLEEYPDLDIALCATPEEVVHDSDAVILVTEWQEYRDMDWDSLKNSMRTPVLLDGRNALDRDSLIRAGFRYLGLAG